MRSLRRGLIVVWLLSYLLEAQQPVAVQKGSKNDNSPSSGGYKAPALSLTELLESDVVLQKALMSSSQTKNSSSSRNTVMSAAQAGDIGAELLLAEAYIPEQCPLEKNQDVPHCGTNGQEQPTVVFRQNSLGLEASYEQAAHWLEKASAQGSGEASEVLAQLITRMLTNGHGTTYKRTDSARLHALARSQAFDVEPISATCYKLVRGSRGLSLGPPPRFDPPQKVFTDDELAALSKAGVSGLLEYGGGMDSGDSVLLGRPEGPAARVRIILDHNPGQEILLPIQAHRDVIYVQQGDGYLAFPSSGSILPRFISLTPPGTSPSRNVALFIQLMDGAYSGSSCISFP